MKKPFFIFIIFFLITSCSHYVVNNEGFTRPPEKYKFGYSKKKSDVDVYQLIDTTSIYYMAEQDLYKYRSEYMRRGEYIRFYSDGRFKMQGVKDFPEIDDINNVNKGIVGYFFIRKNVLKLEIYSDINAGSSQLRFGLIEDNGDINLLDENPRTFYGIGFSEENISKKIKKTIYKPQIYKKIKPEGEMIYENQNW